MFQRVEGFLALFGPVKDCSFLFQVVQGCGNFCEIPYEMSVVACTPEEARRLDTSLDSGYCSKDFVFSGWVVTPSRLTTFPKKAIFS